MRLGSLFYKIKYSCVYVDASARNGAYYVIHPKIPYLADHFDPGGLDLLLSRSVVISFATHLFATVQRQLLFYVNARVRL